jgi:hypothetical protein
MTAAIVFVLFCCAMLAAAITDFFEPTRHRQLLKRSSSGGQNDRQLFVPLIGQVPNVPTGHDGLDLFWGGTCTPCPGAQPERPWRSEQIDRDVLRIEHLGGPSAIIAMLHAFGEAAPVPDRTCCPRRLPSWYQELPKE